MQKNPLTGVFLCVKQKFLSYLKRQNSITLATPNSSSKHDTLVIFELLPTKVGKRRRKIKYIYVRTNT